MSTHYKIGLALLRIIGLLIFINAAIIFWVMRPVWTQRLHDDTAKFVSAINLRQYTKELSTSFLPRSSYHPENLKAAADYIFQRFALFGSNVNYQSYLIEGNEYFNVIANFGPDTDEVIVIGAHYDAFSSHPGADDNASGVAAMLELARLLSEQTLSKRIILVAYACEEPPHFATENMGSFKHAVSIKNKNVRLMISLEMLGFYSATENSQHYSPSILKYLYPTTGDFIAVVGDVFSADASALKSAINHWTALDAYSINAPAKLPGVDFSDHRNYWALNMPAIMVTDTAFLRNPNYHKATDQYDTLDYEKMAKVVYGVFKFVLTL